MAKIKEMRYLIDIGHPAHVHYFRNFALEVIERGEKVLFTCRDKEMTISLLQHYSFQYVVMGKPFKSILGKIFGLVYFTIKLFFIALKYKPNIYLNASMYAAFVAKLFRKPHISLEDTYNMEQVRIYRPFTSCILTGDYDHPSMGKKEVTYSGYQELLYLHPKRFTPDIGVLKELGLSKNEKYVIIRFVSWNASHDIGHEGISLEMKIKAVKEFSKDAKVFISSEVDLPVELEKYKIKISPHRMHDALAFATLLFGESSTMSEEAAMLGVPAVYLFNNSTYYTQHLEKCYALMYNFSETISDQEKAIAKGIELLHSENIKHEWLQKRDKMLSEKIDVTAFMLWFIENFPASMQTMKENPDFQNQFK